MAILEAYVAGDCRGITAASWICNFSCVLEYLIYRVIENDDDEGPEGPDWFAANCLFAGFHAFSPSQQANN